VVATDFLFGALFVGPAVHHYYFGDYFDERYARRGFVAWTDYHIGRGAFDPNFSYYRHVHAAEPRWEPALRELYRGRRAGDVPRPPRTLVQQREAVRNIAINKTTNINVRNNINLTHLQNVTVLAPLKDVHNMRVTHLGSLSQVQESRVGNHVLKLEPVPQAERAREQRATAQIRATAQQRHDNEERMLNQGGVPIRHTDPPKAVRMEYPKAIPPAAAPRPVLRTPPAAPVMPRHEERAIPQYQPRQPPGPARRK
jgi:hypothetical protein